MNDSKKEKQEERPKKNNTEAEQINTPVCEKQNDPDRFTISKLSARSSIISAAKMKERFEFILPTILSPNLEMEINFPVDKYKTEVNQMIQKDILELANLIKTKSMKLLENNEYKVVVPPSIIDTKKYNEEASNISTIVGVEKRIVIESFIDRKKKLDEKSSHTIFYLIKSIVVDICILSKIDALSQHFSTEEKNLQSKITKKLNLIKSENHTLFNKMMDALQKNKEKYISVKSSNDEKAKELYLRNKGNMLRAYISSNDLERDYTNEDAYQKVMKIKADIYAKSKLQVISSSGTQKLR